VPAPAGLGLPPGLALLGFLGLASGKSPRIRDLAENRNDPPGCTGPHMGRTPTFSRGMESKMTSPETAKALHVHSLLQNLRVLEYFQEAKDLI
jgi:hypothetical protein